ncbi:TRAP transporter large permease [Jiella avicenniae]|uniref:TRAP transporter large permease protein n=1 Tax=Jiella avicenniae TaxID=2907202 RepID=A0A9X1P0M6_9HYPH|nr:TRAP transporter large permease [Jiella avicenniae]MCE7027141.1 TRAP transporter large permease [Jiella avicenniae]
MPVILLTLVGATLLIGVPIFLALALTAFLGIGLFTSTPPVIVAQRLFAGIDNFTLMSIPFFVLAADLMRVAGIADRLIRLARVLVGWLPGGLAASGVVACLFFGSISGSSPATLAAVGSIMICALIKAGYPERFSIGLMTTAGSLGIVVPPSITLIIYGAVTGTSIGQLFAAGLVPGIMLAAMLIAYCGYAGWRYAVPLEPRPSAGEVGRAFKDAGFGLGLPVLLLGGIYTGVFTPTESAAVAVAYGLVVGMLVYRSIDLPALGRVLKESGLVSATLLLIAAGASALSWLLASQGIVGDVAAQVLGTTDNPALILLLFNLVLIVAGCFLDGTSAVIILAPLMLKIISSVGIDPVHFGIVTLVNVELGMMTPPVGLNLFVACAITRKPIHFVALAVLPSTLIVLLGLLVITYVPWISMVLPDALYR